jgi:hypothetical protein
VFGAPNPTLNQQRPTTMADIDSAATPDALLRAHGYTEKTLHPSLRSGDVRMFKHANGKAKAGIWPLGDEWWVFDGETFHWGLLDDNSLEETLKRLHP